MKRLFVLLTVVILVGVGVQDARAVLDTDPDILGVYFDSGANSNSLMVGASIPFNAYVILTNPTLPVIQSYEFSYHMAVPAGMEGLIFKLSHAFPPDFIDISLPIYGTFNGYVALSTGAPVPTTVATTLMTFQYMLLVPMSARLTVRAPTYSDGTTDFPLGVPDCDGMINEYCGIAAEKQSFGTVKALYR